MCTAATALLLGDQSESAATLHTSLHAVSKAGRSISDHAFSLLALQAPVASELRAVVATIHIVGNIDRMAGLAANVGRMALRESPRVTLPGDVRDLVVEMSLAAGYSAQNARCAIERGDPLFARQMEQEDGRMNILHRELFEVVMRPRWPHGCCGRRFSADRPVLRTIRRPRRRYRTPDLFPSDGRPHGPAAAIALIG